MKNKLGPRAEAVVPQELQFKPEDFEALMQRLCAHPPHQASTIAEVANRILAERLRTAPEVFVEFTTMEGNEEFTAMSCPDTHHTHRARLVCIEKIDKEKK